MQHNLSLELHSFIHLTAIEEDGHSVVVGHMRDICRGSRHAIDASNYVIATVLYECAGNSTTTQTRFFLLQPQQRPPRDCRILHDGDEEQLKVECRSFVLPIKLLRRCFALKSSFLSCPNRSIYCWLHQLNRDEGEFFCTTLIVMTTE